jgi:multimeric flavodoxin WrbA
VKILACVGSYRKNGNTARVVELIAAQLHAEAARQHEPLELETVYLGHQDIGACRGCRICFDQGEERCPLKDDVLAIKSKMQEADGIIIASPVYVNDVSGIVKSWLDRLAHVCHRPEFAGKCAYLVATVGNGPTRHALRTLNMALSSWGFHVVGQRGFKTGARIKQDELTARYQKQTGGIAHRLFHAIRQQRFSQPSFLALMTFKIQQLYWQQTVEESIDYAHWKSRGWTEPQREFYIPHQANPLKVACARLAGAAIARFVT